MVCDITVLSLGFTIRFILSKINTWFHVHSTRSALSLMIRNNNASSFDIYPLAFILSIS